MDERFKHYRASVFSSVPEEREKSSQDEIKRTNALLSDFLKLLTGYFTEPAAIKTLEHLVRNYRSGRHVRCVEGTRTCARVHVFQVDDCLACGLVYHSTAEFQKLLSVLDVKDTSWQWLSDVQKSQLPFPRDILVKRCLIDPVLFSEVDTCIEDAVL